MSEEHTTPHDPAPHDGTAEVRASGGEPVWGGAAEEFPPGYEEFAAARSRYFDRRGGRRPRTEPTATRRATRGGPRAEARRRAV